MIWFVPERRVFIDGRVDVYPVAMSLRARRADLEGKYPRPFRGARYSVRGRPSRFAALRLAAAGRRDAPDLQRRRLGRVRPLIVGAFRGGRTPLPNT